MGRLPGTLEVAMVELRDTAHLSRIATNGIHLHVAEAGPPDGPLVFLLHGFPEFWYGWRNQIAPLAARGFHVVAPDQRGYNLSDKPRGVAATTSTSSRQTLRAGRPLRPGAGSLSSGTTGAPRSAGGWRDAATVGCDGSRR